MARKSSNSIWWILGGTLVVLVAGLLVAKQAGWIGKEKPAEVELSKVQRATIIEKVSASGKIQPEIEVKLSPDVSGEITELYVAEGDSVVKGQLLLKIRPDNYESQMARARATVDANKASMEQANAALAQSEARLIRLKTNYERSKKLYDDKVIPASEYEQASADYMVAQKDIEAAKANIQSALYNIKGAEANARDAAENLRKTTIFAPVSGIISLLKVEVGERVVGTSQMAGTEMMRIANMDNMEVRVNVNENDIVRVALGDTVEIEVDAYLSTGKKFLGIVREIANTANGLINSTTTTTSLDAVTEFEVRIKILNESYAAVLNNRGNLRYPFKPGMTASVEIVTEKKARALSVPVAAVTTRDTVSVKEDEEGVELKKQQVKEIVFVHQEGKAVAKEVKTGISDFERIEIIEGLSEGQEVVSGPYISVSKKLSDGAPIVSKEAGKKGATPKGK
jgi:HlyD family secretion protein